MPGVKFKPIYHWWPPCSERIEPSRERPISHLKVAGARVPSRVIVWLGCASVSKKEIAWQLLKQKTDIRCFFTSDFVLEKNISKKGRFIEEIDIKSTQIEHSNRTSLNHQILFATTPLLSWNWRISICCFEGKMPAKLHKFCDDSWLAA